ncbi:tetratricopeptide repeat protein [Kangiella sp. TOML190]|uniref:tetratricopeptide repeat protein n=1 Tax=Kangiella sp. TOML190 TaxID=2931351 RepID=UPI00203E43E8|nr:tetratricopeptide repeat protein [Kangiella sp. TOML190]
MIQVADVLADAFETPNWVLKALFITLVAGFPVTGIISWIFDYTGHGFEKTKELPHPSALDIKAIPIIFHGSFAKDISPEVRKEKFKDYVLWSDDYYAQKHEIYEREFLILFKNSIDALRYAIKIQNHSLSLKSPLKISVIEAPKDFSKNFSESEEIIRARTIAVDSQAGAIITTKTVTKAIKNRGIESVEKAFHPLESHQSAIEQEEYIIDPEQIHRVNQALNEYSDTILYPKTPLVLKLAALVFLTVIAAVMWRFIPSLESKSNATIAILPFSNTSADKAHQSFVSGLSEDIFNNIAQIPEINVISRRSSQALENSNLPLKEIGELLNANWILEGSINRVDERVRVSMWISDSDNGHELWNQVFNLSVNDLLVGNRTILKSLANFLEQPIDAVAITKVGDNPNKELYPKYLQAKGLLKQPPTMERLKAIEAIFNQILEQQTDFLPAMAGLCRTYLLMYAENHELSFFEQAENQCTKTYRKQETNVDILIALTKLHILKGNLQEAERFIQTAQSINPSDVEVIYNQSQLESAKGNTEEAKTKLEQAILIEPGYWQLWRSLGIAHLQDGEWDLAVKKFNKVITLLPDERDGYDNLGAAFFFKGQFDDAAAAYEQSLSINRSGAALSNIATMWFYHGDYIKASNYYLQAIQITPKDYRLWLNLADTKAQTPEYLAEARSHYLHALDLIKDRLGLIPNDVEARVIASWCYAQLEDTKQAQNYIDSTLSLNFEDPNTLYMLAKSYARIGQIDKGKAALQESIKLGFPEVVITSSPIIQTLNLYP